MARTPITASMIILDVGRSTSVAVGEEKQTFFEKAKTCVSLLIQSKIFGAPQDQVGLVLMGTEETSNRLNDDSGEYKHICEGFELNVPNWAALRTLENKVSRSGAEATWFDALIVAADYLRAGILGKKVSSCHILLLSPLFMDADANPDQLQCVTDRLQELNCSVHVVTNHVRHPASDDGTIFTSAGTLDETVPTRAKERRHNERQLGHVVRETLGTWANLCWAEQRLAYFGPKSVRPSPWNSTLLIGSKIRLSISAFLQISEQKGVGSFKVDSADGSSAKVQLKTEHFLNDKPIDLDMHDIITGYVYGSTVVPYDSTMDIDYKSGEGRLDCLGFTASDYLLDEHICGKGTYVVMAKKGCAASAQKLAALVSAMIEMQVIMIATKVYRQDTKPRLHALIPTHKKKHPCFVMLELIFQDEMNLLKFPPLRKAKHKPTPEQYDAVGHLIDSMSLMDGIDDGDEGSREAFAMHKTINATQQHVYRAVAHRALYPRDSLPSLSGELKELLEVPKKVAQRAIPALKEVKSAFELKEIQPKARNEWLQRMAKVKLDSESSASATIDSGIGLTAEDDEATSGQNGRRKIETVGTVTPAEDFLLLLCRGEKFATVATQMQNVIFELLFASMRPPGDNVKAALMVYRGEAQKLGPYRYNDWMQEFKSTLLARHKEEFWENVIVGERLGLIDSSESDMSTVSVEQAAEFYKTSAQSKKPTEADSGRDNTDVDSLFGEWEG